MPKNISTGKEDKSAYTNFLKKALDFFNSMKNNLEKGNWNSAGLEAVHSAISANDALLVYFHGIRSISQKHEDAVNLLISLIDKDGVKEAAAHLRRLIAKKNLIAYESVLFKRNDAEDAAKHAERFFNWVKNQIPQ